VVKDMHGHYLWVVAVCYSPDSRFIISGGGDMDVRMWDTSLSYSSLQSMPKVRRRIAKIGFRTGSKHIAVGFSDNSLVALYDMTDFSF
jgi:WD40 repeat protein